MGNLSKSNLQKTSNLLAALEQLARKKDPKYTPKIEQRGKQVMALLDRQIQAARNPRLRKRLKRVRETVSQAMGFRVHYGEKWFDTAQDYVYTAVRDYGWVRDYVFNRMRKKSFILQRAKARGVPASTLANDLKFLLNALGKTRAAVSNPKRWDAAYTEARYRGSLALARKLGSKVVSLRNPRVRDRLHDRVREAEASLRKSNAVNNTLIDPERKSRENRFLEKQRLNTLKQAIVLYASALREIRSHSRKALIHMDNVAADNP